MRLLLSLYSCRPNEGSEPGVGWAWAIGMAGRHETMVVTRAFNRPMIEAELNRLSLSSGQAPRFLYCEAAGWAERLYRGRWIPTQLYYILWQFAARRAYDSQPWRADVIHHVTFCSFMVPGVWWHRKEKVVLGPLGGFSVCPVPFLRATCFAEGCRELLRRPRRWFWWMNPFFVRARRSADCILFTESANAKRFGGRRRFPDAVLDVAVPVALQGACPPEPNERANAFVWAGRLVGTKGCEIALRAFAKAFGEAEGGPRLEIVGDGPDRLRLERLAERLGVGRNVAFLGSVPQRDLWAKIRRAKAFLFTGLRDTCGAVNVEAMACGTPVVCFNHQGVGELTDESCAIRVVPRSWEQAIDSFATALRRFAENPGLVERMGAAGRERAFRSFTWERKFDIVDGIYRTVLGENSGHA